LPPPDSSYWSYGRRPSDFPSSLDNPRESTDTPRAAGEGTGWPEDKPDAKPDKPKTPEEQIRELQSELTKTKSELAGERTSNRLLRDDLQVARNSVSGLKGQLERTHLDRSKLIDTNAGLVHKNMELQRKLESSSVLAGKEVKSAERQEQITRDTPKRRNWFPTDKVGTLGGAVAGVAGTYSVMVGRVASKEEAFAVACAGAGVATVAVGRDLMDKINGWRNKRAEKKNADR